MSFRSVLYVFFTPRSESSPPLFLFFSIIVVLHVQRENDADEGTARTSARFLPWLPYVSRLLAARRGRSRNNKPEENERQSVGCIAGRRQVTRTSACARARDCKRRVVFSCSVLLCQVSVSFFPFSLSYIRNIHTLSLSHFSVSFLRRPCRRDAGNEHRCPSIL